MLLPCVTGPAAEPHTASRGRVCDPGEGADIYNTSRIMLTFASFHWFIWSLLWSWLMVSEGREAEVCFYWTLWSPAAKEPRRQRKYEGFFNLLFLLMHFIYWLIPLFLLKYDSLFGDDVILSSGRMWRMWTRSRGQKASVFVMTSSSVLSSHSDSETDEKTQRKPVETMMQGCARAPSSLRSSFQPAFPNAANCYFILGPACKAPLKICKSKLSVSQGWLWEPGA